MLTDAKSKSILQLRTNHWISDSSNTRLSVSAVVPYTRTKCKLRGVALRFLSYSSVWSFILKHSKRLFELVFPLIYCISLSLIWIDKLGNLIYFTSGFPTSVYWVSKCMYVNDVVCVPELDAKVHELLMPLRGHIKTILLYQQWCSRLPSCCHLRSLQAWSQAWYRTCVQVYRTAHGHDR